MAQYKENCCGVCDAGLELERRRAARENGVPALIVASETSIGMMSLRGADGKSIRRALTDAGFLPGDRVRITKEQNYGQ